MSIVALGHATGIGLALAGLPLLPAFLLLSLLLPLRPWRRPASTSSLSTPLLLPILACAAGLLAGRGVIEAERDDCRLRLPREGRWTVEGRFIARVEPGRAAPFRVETGLPGGCRADIRVTWPRDAAPPATGARLRLDGRWEGRAFPRTGRDRGLWAGRLVVIPDPAPTVAPGGDLAGRPLLLRGRVQDRMHRLWGERAPLVEALMLARREHLDPDVREVFELSGTAHLLAISGFHVGVIAGLLLGVFRLAGLRPRRAAIGSVAGSWLYVLGIGAPDAGLRAAVLMTLFVCARVRGVPAMAVGALSSVFLLMLIVEPAALASIGFQLSFLGTWGLMALRRGVERWIEEGWIRAGGRRIRRGGAAAPTDRWLRALFEGIATGIAATLPTLPFVAWYFDRIPLIGIPATLLATPFVTLAIPGIGSTLLLSIVHQGAGAFLAGGVATLLDLLIFGVSLSTELPYASVWVSRMTIVAATAVGGLVVALLAWLRAGRVRAPARRILGVVWGTAAVLLLPILPILPGARSLELHLIDVGQGDAVALRLPSGRWIVVDTGPSGPGWDAGRRRVVPHLRRHGARRLEALVLTHAHLDHIGGAVAVLDGMRVRGVLEPGRVTPSEAYLATLRRAREREVSWWRAESGRVLASDGVEIHVLHPPAPPSGRVADEGPGADPNDVSVVLLVRHGDAAILLTGDAYADVEERILADLPPLTVLKVGHHGSRTSTSPLLVQARPPGVALIPVGDNNRFGHPHPEVVARLEAAGSHIYRTDRDGTVRIRLGRNGEWGASTSR